MIYLKLSIIDNTIRLLFFYVLIVASVCFSFENKEIEPVRLSSYEAMYRRSLEESSPFWLEQAAALDWFCFPEHSCQYIWNTDQNLIEHTWFDDGSLNVSYNCLDRHLKTSAQKPAIIWQGNDEDNVVILNFEQLHAQVSQCANMLKSLNVNKGDRVCIYLPMIPEMAITMLACARIGAIHSVVFAGFSKDSLAHRINDCQAKILITSNVSIRGEKRISLKTIADAAIEKSPCIQKVVVIQRASDKCEMNPEIDVWYHDAIAKTEITCQPAILEAEHPLFILYTSGSTGKPKGVVHTQGGYLLHAALSHKYVFDIKEDDIYWCTADAGWITGHSYGIYGPLANGTTTLMFEGTPTYPDAGRFWRIIQKFHVTIFYTAPTVIRTLMQQGTTFVKSYDLSSLRVLGTVGEPINLEAWLWYYENIGYEKTPIMDTWWQTETGGVMIAPFSSDNKKPGCACRPFFGIEPIVLNENGNPCSCNEDGALCIKKPWPGMMRTTWGNHQRFIETYFKAFKNVYFTGDGCRVDEEGDYWLLGRIDDVINISGHRIGTSEIESSLMSHKKVVEAAAVAIPHEIKGQGIYAFVILFDCVEGTPQLKKELIDHVRKEIGAIASIDQIQFVKSLPKTRSGKIMRRILRKIAIGESENIGDASTLQDPSIIIDLIPTK